MGFTTRYHRRTISGERKLMMAMMVMAMVFGQVPSSASIRWPHHSRISWIPNLIAQFPDSRQYQYYAVYPSCVLGSPILFDQSDQRQQGPDHQAALCPAFTIHTLAHPTPLAGKTTLAIGVAFLMKIFKDSFSKCLNPRPRWSQLWLYRLMALN